MNETKQSRGLGSGTIIILGLLVLVALVVLVSLVFGFTGKFVLRTTEYVVTTLTAASGWPIHLVRFIVIIAMIPFFVAVAKYTHIWGPAYKRLHPSLNLYRSPSGIVIVLYVALYFLALYFANRDAYWNMYCSSMRNGTLYHRDSPGVDLFGDSCVKCSPDQILWIMAEEKGASVLPNRVLIKDPRNYPFFVGSIPTVWYDVAENGEYELFDHDGRNPRTSRPLRPIDSLVIRELVRVWDSRITDSIKLENEKLNDSLKEIRVTDSLAELRECRQKYLLGSAIANCISCRAIYAFRVRDGQEAADEPTLNSVLVALNSRNLDFRPIFSKAAEHGGVGSALVSGGSSVLGECRLLDKFEELLVIRSSSSNATRGSNGTWIGGDTLSWWIMGKDGAARSGSATGTGAGKTESECVGNARSKAVAQLARAVAP